MSKSLRKEIRCFDTRQTVIRLEDARLPGSAAGFSPAGGENRRQCWQPGRAVINLCFPAVSGRPGHSSPHTALSTVHASKLSKCCQSCLPTCCIPSCSGQTKLNFISTLSIRPILLLRAGGRAWRVAAVLVISLPARPGPAAAQYRVLLPAPSLTTSHSYCRASSSYVPGPQSCLLSNHSLVGLAGRSPTGSRPSRSKEENIKARTEALKRQVGVTTEQTKGKLLFNTKRFFGREIFSCAATLHVILFFCFFCVFFSMSQVS